MSDMYVVNGTTFVFNDDGSFSASGNGVNISGNGSTATVTTGLGAFTESLTGNGADITLATGAFSSFIGSSISSDGTFISPSDDYMSFDGATGSDAFAANSWADSYLSDLGTIAGGDTSDALIEGGPSLSDLLGYGAAGFGAGSLATDVLLQSGSELSRETAGLLGAYDDLSYTANAVDLAGAETRTLEGVAGNLETGSQTFGIAANAFGIGEGLYTLATTDYSDDGSFTGEQIRALLQVSDNSGNLYGTALGKAGAGFGAVSSLTTDLAGVGLYALEGDYFGAADQAAKFLIQTPFAVIGNEIDGPSGADIGANVGSAVHDAASAVGAYIADNVTDPFLDTSLGQAATQFYYDMFLQ